MLGDGMRRRHRWQLDDLTRLFPADRCDVVEEHRDDEIQAAPENLARLRR